MDSEIILGEYAFCAANFIYGITVYRKEYGITDTTFLTLNISVKDIFNLFDLIHSNKISQIKEMMCLKNLYCSCSKSLEEGDWEIKGLTDGQKYKICFKGV